MFGRQKVREPSNLEAITALVQVAEVLKPLGDNSGAAVDAFDKTLAWINRLLDEAKGPKTDEG